jgi:cyclohexyl-isocyanide hydratase
MKIAFVVYNGMTSLDFMGVFDPLFRLKKNGDMPGLELEICAPTEEVVDNAGLCIMPGRVGLPLDPYDMVIIPGGDSIRELLKSDDFISWIKTAAGCRHIVSVCGGSLLLGAAELLQNKKATTHPNLYEYLARFGAIVEHDRIVEDGNIITARGVTSSIDLGLYLCEKLAGREAKETIRRQMDYQQ